MSERLASLRRLALARVRPWWNRLVGWMEYKIDEPISNRRAGLIVTGGVGLALLAVYLLIATIGLLLRGTVAAAHTTGQLPKSDLAQVASDPLQHWVAAHTVGLGVSPAAVLAV